MEATPILITLLFSFGLCALTMPWFIKKMKAKGQAVRDYYKKDQGMILNNAGILILFVTFITIIIVPLLFRFFFKFGADFPRGITPEDTAILMVVLLYAFYGVLDDFLDVGRFSKILIPLMFSYPLVIVLSGWDPWVPFVGQIGIQNYGLTVPALGIFTGSMFLRYIIVPIYIMVVANMKNMHAGFNGLQSGTALIILSFLLLKSAIDDNLTNMYTIAAIVGAQIVFFWYNKYPSRILEGNIGSLAIGAAIGAGFIVQHYLFAGIVMLIPHIINFLMYLYWRIMHRRHPEDPKWDIIKFGKLRDDGTLEVPNRLTLKWLLPYHFRMTERQVVYSMYVLTLMFCVLGLFVPG